MIPNRFLPAASVRRSAIALVAVLPLLAACGGGGDKKADQPASDLSSNPTASVEALYNNGMDALNAKRYASAADQFTSIEAELPVFPLGGACTAHGGIHPVSAKSLHGRDRDV